MPGVARRAPGSVERQLETRLKWLMFGRLAIALASILAIFLIRPRDPYPPYWVLVAACLLNLVYLILTRAGVPLQPLAMGQILLDVVIVGGLVYFTGIAGFFAYLYLPAMIAAAMILGPRMAIAMASVASVVLATVSTLYLLSAHPDYAWRLPLVDPELTRTHFNQLSFLLPFLFLFALSLHVAALLAGKLSAEASRIRILNEEILQNMAGGVLAADRFGGIQFINSQAARLLGVGEADLVRGRHIDDALPGPVADLLHRAIRGQERAADEISVGGKPVRVAVSCLLDGEHGPLRGVVAMLNDLSLRTQMEEMTRRAERFKALLEMSAGMAHEIRNPLASIRGAAQELGSSKLPKEDDRQLLQVVIRESDRLDQIISEFLDYASDRPTETMLVDLAGLLRETALLLEARRAPDVKIEREIPRTMLCRGSPDKLKQVFLNLGLNALDACSQNGKPGRVLIRCLPSRGTEALPGEGVLVEVTDNGGGVSRENLSRLFEPFFTTKPQGVGMGLAIARKIVHSHGGEVTLESEEGKGTTVRVLLPS